MKIVRPYAVIMNPFDLAKDKFGEAHLKHIEWCARISHRSEEDQAEQSYQRFLESVVKKHGDWSVVEACCVSVDCLVDRGITHEIVRHRVGSYTQESTRFVNYAKKMPPSFIYPIPDIECSLCLDGCNPMSQSEDVNCEWFHPGTGSSCIYNPVWLTGIQQCERAYQRLLATGWRPQEARSVFPNALASRIIITYNLRSWRHFFLMRTTKEAHPQIRQVMIPLLAEFKKLIPVLYDDIEPNATQIENLRKGR